MLRNPHWLAILFLTACVFFMCKSWKYCPLPPRFSHDMLDVAVRYQSTCGSCWAHASAAALQKRYQLVTGKLAVFDDSDLIDNVRGNRGGSVIKAYEYCKTQGLLANGKRVTISAWANFANATRCQIKREIFQNGPITAHLLEYASMKQLGPKSVWAPLPGEPYIGGHAVVIYGWDDVLGGWMVQNSWGESWAEQGRGVFAYGKAGIEEHFLLGGVFI